MLCKAREMPDIAIDRCKIDLFFAMGDTNFFWEYKKGTLVVGPEWTATEMGRTLISSVCVVSQEAHWESDLVGILHFTLWKPKDHVNRSNGGTTCKGVLQDWGLKPATCTFSWCPRLLLFCKQCFFHCFHSVFCVSRFLFGMLNCSVLSSVVICLMSTLLQYFWMEITLSWCGIGPLQYTYMDNTVNLLSWIVQGLGNAKSARIWIKKNADDLVFLWWGTDYFSSLS